VLPIDLETGALGEPENLGASDLSDRALTACTEASAGWVVDTPLMQSTTLRIDKKPHYIQSALARLRITAAGACVEAVGGSADQYSSTGDTSFVRTGGTPAPPTGAAVRVAVSQGRDRYPLRCTVSR
jgi:hypothetical protein